MLLCYMLGLAGLIPAIFAACPDGTEARTEQVEYSHDGDKLLGYLAHCTSDQQSPGILVLPDWNGRDSYENGRAVQLAELGYVGFAVDIYGNGRNGATPQENSQLMQPWTSNRNRYVARLRAALNKLRTYEFVNRTQVAAQGYCFGGLGVLDMARAGVDLLGVVSFHGNLAPPPEDFQRGTVTAKVLVQTGYDDPSVKPDKVNAFEEEMKAASADYQVISFGSTVHSFTVPSANNPGQSMYNALSDKRSWNYMKLFYKEIFSTSS